MISARSCGSEPGRSRKPERPASCQSTSNSASSSGVPTKTSASEENSAPFSSSRPRLRLSGGFPVGVEKDDEVGEDQERVVFSVSCGLLGSDLVSNPHNVKVVMGCHVDDVCRSRR